MSFEPCVPLPKNTPRILTIAGSDSGGGAGIQADLKTFTALGCYGMTAITAVTSQNSVGVHWLEHLSVKSIDSQIQAIATDFGVDAVKIGMLSQPEIVTAIGQAIEQYGLQNIVLDPVLVASSGAILGAHGIVERIAQELFRFATIITPNLFEASQFLGVSVSTPQDMHLAAQALLKMGPQAVLIKGGHLTGHSELVDLLYMKSEEGYRIHEFFHPKLDTLHTHGTGCTLSSAIACGLGFGLNLSEAVGQGVGFVQQALKHGTQLNLTPHNGPLWHAFAQYPKTT